MAGIGDYVHYYAKNYLNYGTTKENAFNMWKSQKGAIRNKANSNRSPLTKAEREELQLAISSIIKSAPGEDSKIASAQYMVENLIVKEFDDAARRLNWDTGNMEWEDDEKNRVLGKLHRSRNETKQLELDLKKTLDKANKLKTIMENYIGVPSAKDAQRLRHDMKDLQALIRQTERKMKARVKQQGWTWQTPEMTDLQLMQNINRLIETYAAYPNINTQKGYALEAIIAMAPYVAQEMAIEEAAKQISGGQHEKVEIDSKRFADFLQLEVGNNVFAEISGSSSQGKVDVRLNWNNKIAKISAKNVNLSSGHAWVHIVSGSSLLFLLQDTNTIFLNHFLNLMAEHPDNSIALKEKRQQILTEVKLILFYKALSGNSYKRSSADTFIINDNSSKSGVRVYCINDIVQSVLNSGSTQNISITNTAGTSINNIRFQNTWIDGDESGKNRITNLLLFVHQQKINVKFNASNVLNNLDRA